MRDVAAQTLNKILANETPTAHSKDVPLGPVVIHSGQVGCFPCSEYPHMNTTRGQSHVCLSPLQTRGKHLCGGNSSLTNFHLYKRKPNELKRERLTTKDGSHRKRQKHISNIKREARR